MKTYTTTELKAFEHELAIYLEEKTLRDGTKIKTYNYDNYLKDKGIFVYYSEQKTYAIREDKIKVYQDFQDKVDQLSRLRGRREYAQKKEAEELFESNV